MKRYNIITIHEVRRSDRWQIASNKNIVIIITTRCSRRASRGAWARCGATAAGGRSPAARSAGWPRTPRPTGAAATTRARYTQPYPHTGTGPHTHLQVQPVHVGRQAVVGDEQQVVGVQLGGLVQQVRCGHVGQRAPYAHARAYAHAHAAGRRVSPAHAHGAAGRTAAADDHAAVRRLHNNKAHSLARAGARLPRRYTHHSTPVHVGYGAGRNWKWKHGFSGVSAI